MRNVLWTSGSLGWSALRSPRLLLNLQRQIALRNSGECSVLDLQRLRWTMDCSLLMKLSVSHFCVWRKQGMHLLCLYNTFKVVTSKRLQLSVSPRICTEEAQYLSFLMRARRELMWQFHSSPPCYYFFLTFIVGLQLQLFYLYFFQSSRILGFSQCSRSIPSKILPRIL